jgi:glycosyltransferase involved in cell wall biosynthesis
MKILVVCQYYYPEEFQINSICESLAVRGHQVTVLTGLPNYPTGIIPKSYKWRKRHEFHNGVEIYRAGEIPRGHGIFRLALNYVSFVIFSSIKALFLKKNFDVIYVYQLSPVFMAIPGIILKKITGKRFFLYCCDLWPESVKVMGIKKDSVLFKLIGKVSTYIYQNCDCIGIQSKAFSQYFQEVHHIPNSSIVYIPQFADSQFLEEDLSEKHDYINFVFLGNIGLAQDLDCVVKAVCEIRNIPCFRVHIIGDGSYLATLKERVITNKLDHIFKFYGRRPYDEMGKYYKLADVCLLTLSHDSIIGETIPSKLQGYMAAGKIVAAAIDGPAREIVSESDCGRAVPAGDSTGLAECMKDMILHIEKYNQCGKNGRTYFKTHFTKEKYIENTESVLAHLAEA